MSLIVSSTDHPTTKTCRHCDHLVVLLSLLMAKYWTAILLRGMPSLASLGEYHAFEPELLLVLRCLFWDEVAQDLSALRNTMAPVSAPQSASFEVCFFRAGPPSRGDASFHVHLMHQLMRITDPLA